MKHTKIEALKSLDATAKWNWTGEDYSGLSWDASNSKTKPTESEINAEITRLDGLEPMRLLRLERDARLAATDWRASSDLTLSDAWKTYRQKLRDLPASASPTVDSNGFLNMSSVTWPTAPS